MCRHCIGLKTFCMSVYTKFAHNVVTQITLKCYSELILVSSERYPYLLMQQTKFEVEWLLV